MGSRSLPAAPVDPLRHRVRRVRRNQPLHRPALRAAFGHHGQRDDPPPHRPGPARRRSPARTSHTCRRTQCNTPPRRRSPHCTGHSRPCTGSDIPRAGTRPSYTGSRHRSRRCHSIRRDSPRTRRPRIGRRSGSHHHPRRCSRRSRIPAPARSPRRRRRARSSVFTPVSVTDRIKCVLRAITRLFVRILIGNPLEPSLEILTVILPFRVYAEASNHLSHLQDRLSTYGRIRYGQVACPCVTEFNHILLPRGLYSNGSH